MLGGEVYSDPRDGGDIAIAITPRSTPPPGVKATMIGCCENEIFGGKCCIYLFEGLNLCVGGFGGGAGGAFIANAITGQFFGSNSSSLAYSCVNTIAIGGGIATITLFNLNAMRDLGGKLNSFRKKDKTKSDYCGCTCIITIARGVLGSLAGIQSLVMSKDSIYKFYGDGLIGLIINIISAIYTGAGSAFSLDLNELRDGQLSELCRKEINLKISGGSKFKTFVNIAKIIVVILGFLGTIIPLGYLTYKGGYAKAEGDIFNQFLGVSGLIGLLCPITLIANGLSGLLPTTKVEIPVENSSHFISMGFGRLLTLTASLAQSGIVANAAQEVFSCYDSQSGSGSGSLSPATKSSLYQCGIQYPYLVLVSIVQVAVFLAWFFAWYPHIEKIINPVLEPIVSRISNCMHRCYDSMLSCWRGNPDSEGLLDQHSAADRYGTGSSFGRVEELPDDDGQGSV